MAAAAAALSLGWICSASCYSRSRVRVRCSLKPPPPPPPTPWLILRPEERAYKFYSVAEDRVLSLKKKDGAAAPPLDALLVGSSHGWLALLERESNCVFLSNPISGRHVRLPPSYPGRIILSGSPDDDECYAVRQSFEPAYCAVGATEWTELAADESLFYGDLAYCSSRRALSLITHSSFEFDSGGVRVANATVLFYCRSADHQIDDWDLGRNSKVGTTWFWKFEGPPHHWKENEDGELLTGHCWQELHLVYGAAAASSPLIVVRFVSREGKTRPSAGFVVLEMDGEGRSIRVVDDLKGMALFVGANHSFAIPATTGGMLKPNSIYFAPSSIRYGNNIDVGIFDYESKTFSHFNKLLQQFGKCPMWFTPSSR